VLPNAVPGAPSAETCNGVDDNCDGSVDEGIVDDMVKVTVGGSSFFVDRYESSRPDATSASAGVLESRACVKPGVLPWTQASFAEANAACLARGARLCTSTELQSACELAATKTYPYGSSYDPNGCNGEDYDGVPGGQDDDVVLPTGALATCQSGGVYDLSGNVAEWTSTLTGNTGAPANLSIYVTKGGSYLTPQSGLTCQFNLSRATSNAITPSLGFRCCK
jgi:formylglycine-generating enzyme required for sulfatase activity